MFKPNTKHLQPAILTAASERPEKQQKRLKASRPNGPVNVLVGLEALKAGFGWSGQEL
jgi:hypothetical protein